MGVIVKTLVYTTLIVSCSEQFVFPDRLGHAWNRKLSPSVLSRTEFQNRRAGDEINYPDMEQVNVINDERSNRKYLNTNIYCETGDDYCSEPLVYPSSDIAKALSTQKSVVKSMFDTSLPKIQARSGFNSIHHMENVCSMSTSHIMPRAAKNKNGEFKFLVNGGKGAEEYIQLVQISQCLGAGESCGHGNIFSREVTECKQEFSDHKLVALDEEGQELIIDTFSFPSCCSCYMHTGLEV